MASTHDVPPRPETPDYMDEDDDLYDTSEKPTTDLNSQILDPAQISIPSSLTAPLQTFQLPGLGSISTTGSHNDGPVDIKQGKKDNAEPPPNQTSTASNTLESANVHEHTNKVPETVQLQGAVPSSSVLPGLHSSTSPVQEYIATSDTEEQKVEALPQPVEADTHAQVVVVDEAFIRAGEAAKGDTNAEWELDSDPESSQDSSSSESSSDSDDSDDSEDYPLLSPAEQARILMSEPEDGDAKQSVQPPKTTNEQPDEQFTKPNVTITPDMEITELGKVRHVVGNLLLVAGNTSGEYQVLESGSILCSLDRTLIGAVNEPIGPVQGPLYSVGFPTSADITTAGIEEGSVVYYVNQLSTYVFTQPLKAVKGTDASNLHDEEIMDDEIEFSDDEQEAAYKRNLKQAKKAAKEQKFGDQGSKYPGNYSDKAPNEPVTSSLNYDDEDDLYTPLARPSDFSSMVGPHANTVREDWKPSPQRSGRERFQRGRGDRGRSDRGRGDRGRGDRGGRMQRGGRQFNERNSPDRKRIDRRNEPYLHGRVNDGRHDQPPRNRSGSPSTPSHHQTTLPPPTLPNLPNFSNSGQLPFPFPPPPLPIASGPVPPPGSFINPDFFQNQMPFAQYQSYPQQQSQPASQLQIQPTQWQQHQHQQQQSPQPSGQRQLNLQAILSQLQQTQSQSPPAQQQAHTIPVQQPAYNQHQGQPANATPQQSLEEIFRHLQSQTRYGPS